MLQEMNVKKQAIFDTVIRAVTEISADAHELLTQARDKETNETARSMLQSMLDNVAIAKEKDKAVCQSPGYPTCWVIHGEDFPGYVKEAVEEAVGEATRRGYLRPSIVDPLSRINTGDNSGKGVPNMGYEYRPGQEYVDFYISLKGCGAELGNTMQILTPAKLGKDFAGIKRLVMDTVIAAGGKPCPPYSIGIGIGGQMDVCCKLSRREVSTRKWNDVNPDPQLAAMEQELKDNINSLGLGAAGIGGDTVCLAVKIGKVHTHTAIAPVAINFHCWVARRAGIRIYPDGTTEVLL